MNLGLYAGKEHDPSLELLASMHEVLELLSFKVRGKSCKRMKIPKSRVYGVTAGGFLISGLGITTSPG